MFFGTVTLVFSVMYLVEINEFFNFWSQGYSYDIPIGPKYFTASLLTWYLVVTIFGAICWGCNLRTGSIQNQIHEALESRPIANLELVAGRLLSFIALSSIPVVFASILISIYGFVDTLFGLAYGEVPEMWSIFAFVLWDIVPNLAFWGATSMFLTVLSRSRFVGATLTSCLFVGWCVLTMGLPLEILEEPHRVPTLTFLIQAAPILPFWLLESLQSFSASAMYPSEIAPVFASASLVVQRLAMLVLATAIVCGAALCFPRSQVSRRIGAQVGIALVGFALLLLVGSSYQAWRNTHQTEVWAAVHLENEMLDVLDLEHVSGRVELHPAKFISLDIKLQIGTPELFQATEAVFAFNPGFQIDDVYLNGIPVSGYEFKSGLLKVPWDPKITAAELHMLARGKPLESFAYMDAVIDVANLKGKQLRRLRNLGTESTIFHSAYVALLPGSHWYPTPGVATGRENLDKRATDFHTFDLEISTHRDWLVVAPGERAKDEVGNPDTYRIRSSVPVPSITIVSSKFARSAITAEGVEFELLVSPHRRKSLEHLVGVEIELTEWLAERLKRARLLGLEYPFDRFIVVEVPSNLRIFGGGWQMDSTLGPPGLFLVRESGLLSVRFDRDNDTYRRWNEREQREVYMLPRLLNRLRYDVVGENPYLAFSRNFLTNQTTPTGDGALALQFVIDRLITQLVLEQETYFSIQDLLTKDLYKVHSDLWWGKEFAGKYFDQPSVWFSAESISLSDLEQLPDWNMRRQVLWHKGYAIIRSLRDYYGSEVLARVFRDVLDQHRGGNFSFEELAELTPQEYRPMNAVIQDLLLTSKAPGYFASDSELSMIDVRDGTDEVLSSFVLYNDEESAGFIRVYNGSSLPYELEGDRVLTGPIWFDAKQAQKISLRSSQPYRSIHVKPYFSLNRAYTTLYFDPPDEHTQRIEESEIPPLVQPTDWQPPLNDQNVVVVDDLDPGFSIVKSSNLERVRPIHPKRLEGSPSKYFKPAHYYLPQQPDEILANVWHRVRDGWGFGKYRPTWVRIKSGRGQTLAQFEATLPHPGKWQLEYHVMNEGFHDRYVRMWYDFQITTKREYRAGNILITVRNGTVQSTLDFDFIGSEYGWKFVGEYDIVENEVAALVSDAIVGSVGTTVYADAIRWTYVGEKTKEESSQQ